MELTSKIIQRYAKRSLPWLRKKAGEYFRKYIRLRDQHKGCISCGATVQHAGHFYSAGHYPALEFNEANVHGQCLRCNNFLHGNLNEYRKNLPSRISEEGIEDLDLLAGAYKQNGYKHDRYHLIEVIEIYKRKIKELNN